MQKFLIAALLLCAGGCTAAPKIRTFLFTQGEFARVSVASQPTQNGERVNYSLIIFNVYIPESGRPVNRGHQEQKIRPILELQDFYITPGTYVIEYMCGSNNSRTARRMNLQFHKSGHHTVSCSPETGDLVL